MLGIIVPVRLTFEHRYLEAMQQMAKTANSKVIFLPATNQTVQAQMARNEIDEGPSNFGNSDDGFQRAINANVVEHI